MQKIYKLIEKQNQNLLFEISLFLNKELLENHKISYKIFQQTETYLLKQMKRRF